MFNKKQIAVALVSSVVVSFIWGILFWGFLYDPAHVFENFNEAMQATGTQLKQQGLPEAHLLLGILHCLTVTTLALIFCHLTWRTDQTPSRTFATIVVAGLMGCIYCQLDGPIWFLLPWKHPLALLSYDCVSWLLLGSTITLSLHKLKR